MLWSAVLACWLLYLSFSYSLVRCIHKMTHVKWQLLYLSVVYALVHHSSQLFSTEGRQSLKQKQVKQMMMLIDGNDWGLWLATAQKHSLNGKLLLLSQLCDYNLQVIVFELLIATVLYIFTVKTMLLDSVSPHPKTHHFFVVEQIDERKKTFQPSSPGLEAFFQSINHLAKAFQLGYKNPMTLNRTWSL